MHVEFSSADDFPQWIRLAEQVEPLFGPMTEEPAFHEGIRQAIRDRHALCIRKADCNPELAGGIVISAERNEILWFAVDRSHRGKGMGRILLDRALSLLDSRRPVTVTTFAASIHAGLPARKLYESCGFSDLKSGGRNSAGLPVAVMVRPPDLRPSDRKIQPGP